MRSMVSSIDNYLFLFNMEWYYYSKSHPHHHHVSLQFRAVQYYVNYTLQCRTTSYDVIHGPQLYIGATIAILVKFYPIRQSSESPILSILEAL